MEAQQGACGGPRLKGGRFYIARYSGRESAQMGTDGRVSDVQLDGLPGLARPDERWVKSSECECEGGAGKAAAPHSL